MNGIPLLPILPPSCLFIFSPASAHYSSSHLRPQHTHVDAAVPLGRALGGGQATLGLPIQHRPYQEVIAISSIGRSAILCCKSCVNDAARRVVIPSTPLPFDNRQSAPPSAHIMPPSPPHLRPTNALPGPLHVRISLRNPNMKRPR